MTFPFTLPQLENGLIPSWNGKAFQVGDAVTNVLQYSLNESGWNDELTFFHEESAGENHFIDLASRAHALSQLKTYVKKDATILEVGCSSGFMLQDIYKHFPKAFILGSDVVSAPLNKLAERLPNIPLLRFDLTRSPLPSNSLDAIILLNVLEHIENDNLATEQLYRMLKPGGIAIIELPAGPELYDIYDKVLMHYRRYKLNDLKRQFTQQGFHVLKASHLGFFIYPAFAYVKKQNQKLLDSPPEAQQQKVDQVIKDTLKNKIMSTFMQAELFLGKKISYPKGIRCLLTVQK